ncbi:MAG: hypothetical protein HQL54_14345, partial [Magnetococcales bacterium]|nr:hypothetical protein [Magnetococcales bacterium]
LSYLGFIPSDPMLVKAIREQGLVVEMFPSSASSESFGNLTSRLINLWKEKDGFDDGRLTFFWRRSIPGSAERE